MIKNGNTSRGYEFDEQCYERNPICRWNESIRGRKIIWLQECCECQCGREGPFIVKEIVTPGECCQGAWAWFMQLRADRGGDKQCEGAMLSSQEWRVPRYTRKDFPDGIEEWMIDRWYIDWIFGAKWKPRGMVEDGYSAKHILSERHKQHDEQFWCIVRRIAAHWRFVNSRRERKRRWQ